MSAQFHSTVAARSDGSRNAGALSRVVYRSQAVGSVSPLDLQQLTEVSQARNSREAITGIMLYDNSRFFQWLEGPADGVERVMGSIRNDKRHRDIEILSKDSAAERTFGDWSMKLAAPAPTSVVWQDVIEPPREVVETLRRQPDAAAVLLVKLAPSHGHDTAAEEAPPERMRWKPLHGKTAAVLKDVIISSVIPTLAGNANEQQSRSLAVNPRAAELANLLVSSDEQAAAELIQELRAVPTPFKHLYATLFEPAARSLGDLWSEDECSEFEVSLGLHRLQAAVRLLNLGCLPPLPRTLPGPAVLVVPQPGEAHRLAAAFDSDVLWNAGWSPRSESPSDDKALQEMVAAQWFDVLDLSLSPAFRREDRLGAVSSTIAAARRASSNPALMVMVAGRIFVEEKMAGSQVGADMASTTASDVNRSIERTLSSTGTSTACAAETRQVIATAS